MAAAWRETLRGLAPGPYLPGAEPGPGSGETADPQSPSKAAGYRSEAVGYRGPIACQAAGITYRQLDYWAQTGLVEPSIRAAHGPGSTRLYSFRDILMLKVVQRLLDTGISIRQIRVAVNHLSNRETDDLTDLTLLSDGAGLHEPASPEEAAGLLQSGQAVFGIAVGRIWHEVSEALAGLPAERPASRDARDEPDLSALSPSQRADLRGAMEYLEQAIADRERKGRDTA